MSPCWDDAVTVFDYFHSVPIAIEGSYPCTPETAADIDVLCLLCDWEWKALCGRLGVRYVGYDIYGPLEQSYYTPTGAPGEQTRHLRCADVHIPGVARRVHLITVSGVRRFDDWPYALLLRSGEIRNPGRRFGRGLTIQRVGPVGNPYILL